MRGAGQYRHFVVVLVFILTLALAFVVVILDFGFGRSGFRLLVFLAFGGLRRGSGGSFGRRSIGSFAGSGHWVLLRNPGKEQARVSEQTERRRCKMPQRTRLERRQAMPRRKK